MKHTEIGTYIKISIQSKVEARVRPIIVYKLAFSCSWFFNFRRSRFILSSL